MLEPDSLQLAPERAYFVISKYDNDAGVLESAVAARGDLTPRYQAFVSARRAWWP